jgi:hypothetical protein
MFENNLFYIKNGYKGKKKLSKSKINQEKIRKME